MSTPPPSYHRFIELAPGMIRPSGHLKEFLERQHSGLTGNYRQMGWPFTTDMWAGKITDAHFSEGVYRGDDTPVPAGDGPWWPYEQTAYLLDGMLRLSLLIDVPELAKLYENNLEYLLRHPDTQGMLGHNYHSSDSEWPMAVFFKSVIAWVDATGDRRVITAFHRHYKALPLEKLGNCSRNLTNIEGVLKVYEWTGDRTLLDKAVAAYDLVDRLADQKDDFYATLNFGKLISGERISMHGVSFAEMIKLPALLYGATGNQHYLDGARRGLDQAYADHIQLTGQLSSNEFLSGRDPLQGFETCVTSDMMWSLGSLVKAAGDVRYADRMEDLAYNALPGAVTKDFTALQYFSSVNQVNATPFSNNTHFGFGETMMRQYRPTHFPQCCPGNVHRAMPNYVLRMWMRDAASGAPAAVLYGPCKLKFTYQGQSLVINQKTDYPFDDNITFEYQGPDLTMPLWLRIPQWCDTPECRIGGMKVAFAVADGFARIERQWHDGDSLEWRLPARIELCGERQWRAVRRGPLLFSYAVPASDRRDGDSRFAEHILEPSAPWHYGLMLTPQTAEQLEVIRTSGPYPFETPTITLKVPAVPVTNFDALVDERYTPPVPLFHHPAGAVVELTLQPYATTLTRISAFADLVGRKPLPVVMAYVSPRYPYTQKLPLREQNFAPGYWSIDEFRKCPQVQRNADGYFDLERHFYASENTLCYMLFRFWADAPGEAVCAIGAASSAQCLSADGQELFLLEGLHEAELMEPQWFPLPVVAGYNYLRVKCATRVHCPQHRRAWGVKLDIFVNG